MSSNFDRRDFLKQAAAAGFALGLTGNAFAQGQPAEGKKKRGKGGRKGRGARRGQGPAIVNKRDDVPASERLNVAVIGLHGRGQAHIGCLSALPGVEITHVCDVDSESLKKGVELVKARTGKEPQAVKDFRKILDDKSIHAITIATPDHWHTPMSIMAMAAGKHVYCEKPATQNPCEGELLVAAVKKYGKVFQMGNQRRSYPNVISAVEQIQSGKLIGDAYFARAWYANARGPIGARKPMAIPAWLGPDGYELWQGPAPRVPFTDNVIHYKWHWYWHWGTGEALNNGTHEIDNCRWALGLDRPTKVASLGGHYNYKKPGEWGETPDTQTIVWDFDGGKGITWEGRSANALPSEALDRGALIYGTDGSVLLNGDSYVVYDKKGKKVNEIKGRQLDATNTISTDIKGDQLHFYNFIQAVRGKAKINSPAEEGTKSCLMLHLGNIAWRTGSQLNIDPATGHIKDNAEAMKLWKRDYEKGPFDPTQYVTLG